MDVEAIHEYQEHNISPWVEEGVSSPQNAPHNISQCDDDGESSTQNIITEILQMDNMEVQEGESSTQNIKTEILQIDNMEFSINFDNLSPMDEESAHTAETGVLGETQAPETKKRKMVSDDSQIPLKYYRTSVIVQNPNVPQPQAVQVDQEPQMDLEMGQGHNMIQVHN